eukprot:Rmarinus@m.7569
MVKAVAFLVGKDCGATVTFEQASENAPTKITCTATGLKQGDHGFHVHAFGDLTNGCMSAGPHYNPFNKNHGGPADSDRHVGDLGNISAKADGTATLSIDDSQVKLLGPNSVVGRALVIHEGTDDLGKGGHDDSLTTGHAGARQMCGVIGLTQ